MQIFDRESVAQEAKENLAEQLHKSCEELIEIELIRSHLDHFFREHKKSNSIARIRAITEYVANKRFNHSYATMMLQTAYNRTRKAWDSKIEQNK